jgi:O-antigen/teichoic acid export membrane protein
MEDSKMKKHVTLVAAIQISFSVLGMLGAMILFFALGFARTQVGDEEVAKNVLGILIICLPGVIGMTSILGLIGGIGLFTYRSWARYLVIVVAALGCLNIPFGTAKGVYALWVLLQNETIKMFSVEKTDQPAVQQ